MKTRTQLISVFVAALISVSSTLGQTKRVEWSTFSMGYDVSASTKHVIKSVIGQNFVDTSQQSAFHVNSGFLTDTLVQHLAFAATLSVSGSWNLLSVPIITPSYAKSYLFPTAASSAFAYQGSYVTRDSLSRGVGYWLKFNSQQPVNFLGETLLRDTIPVSAHWNMIGSISSPVPVASVSSIPSGLIVSGFFRYVPPTGYSLSDSILPGHGYWVKVNQSGSLVLSSTSGTQAKNLIKIVYDSELPPPPPEFGSTSPRQYTLWQNYPNPFNPNTVIRYELPVAGKVSLRIYNVLGQQVKTLIDEFQEAGEKSVTLNASELSSGVYFYRIRVGNFMSVKKMLLIR